jgi:hypothetical protein
MLLAGLLDGSSAARTPAYSASSRVGIIMSTLFIGGIIALLLLGLDLLTAPRTEQGR